MPRGSDRGSSWKSLGGQESNKLTPNYSSAPHSAIGGPCPSKERGQVRQWGNGGEGRGISQIVGVWAFAKKLGTARIGLVLDTD